VLHLEDLMLRRTRLGLILPQGGIQHLERIRALCQAELGWHDARWKDEQDAYIRLWQAHYSLPAAVPEWRRETTLPEKVSRRLNRAIPIAIGVTLTAMWIFRRKRANAV
jgi:glycerol-3-phosphate dehydrogenase